MTKKQLLTTLTVSTLLLAQAGLVSADEVTPTDPSQPVTEVLTPTDPVAPVETPDEQPSQPTGPKSPVDEVTPTDPTQPSTGEEETPTDPSQPSEQPTPSEPEVSDKDTTPVVETPKEEPKTPTTPTAPKEGEVSKATGQVVSVVTPKAPIETNTGVSIVSTQEGQLILSDGSKVAPEMVGAKTNDDKTITVTKADGSKATLPHTGEAQTLGLSLLGLAMAGLGFAFWKKKKTN
ncbi:TPA: LPXTG cell wall anchor domain-containing protein [Streptococcus agalactiae]|nr:LPXTG cell wall anchor domain-containing protein [Streptococcus agalactiae]